MESLYKAKSIIQWLNYEPTAETSIEEDATVVCALALIAIAERLDKLIGCLCSNVAEEEIGNDNSFDTR